MDKERVEQPDLLWFGDPRREERLVDVTYWKYFTGGLLEGCTVKCFIPNCDPFGIPLEGQLGHNALTHTPYVVTKVVVS
jgi:hypothetical protein